LTGFGPFPGLDANASTRFVKSLAGLAARRFTAQFIHHAILPTQWAGAPLELSKLKTRFQPDVVLHFGVSKHAKGMVLEQVARNICGCSQDACGVVPESSHIAAGAPDELRATYPAQEIHATLSRAAIPVELSQDAGSYLCNAILYDSLLEDTERTKGAHPSSAMIGFIHLPVNLGHPDCFLSWRMALKAGLDIVNVCSKRALRI